MPPTTATPSLLENYHMLEAIRDGFRDARGGLRDVPPILKRVLREDRWREVVVEVTGEKVHFERFIDYVTTPPLEGMGADLDLLQRICADDKEALDLLDRAVQRPDGGDHRSESYRTTVSNINSGPVRPAGTSAEFAIRTLRSRRPELHAEVLAGQKSPHAAMVEAGFRPKTVTVPLDIERAARTLARHFHADEEAIKSALCPID